MPYKPHKYRVAAPADRTYRGKVYDSKAERDYAEILWSLIGIEYAEIVEQPRICLGVRENVYVPDFLVIPMRDPPMYVDVKGMETAKFKKDKRLYATYGRLPLFIIVRKGKRFEVNEKIVPQGGRSALTENGGCDAE